MHVFRLLAVACLLQPLAGSLPSLRPAAQEADGEGAVAEPRRHSQMQMLASLEAGAARIEVGNEEGETNFLNAYDVRIVYRGNEEGRWGLLFTMGGRVSRFGIDAGVAGSEDWGLASGPSEFSLIGDTQLRLGPFNAGGGFERRLIRRGTRLGGLDLWGVRFTAGTSFGSSAQTSLQAAYTTYLTGELAPEDGRGLAVLDSGHDVALRLQHVFRKGLLIGFGYSRTNLEHDPLSGYNKGGRLNHAADQIAAGVGYVFR